MNLQKYKIFILVLISFFPVWILRSNLSIIEILLSLVIFFILPFLIFKFLFIFKSFKINNNSYIALMSLIIFYGIDNHLGLKNGLMSWNADIAMIIKNSVLIIFTFIMVIFITIKYTNTKTILVFFTFLSVVGIYNIFDQTKSYKKITNFEHASKYKFNKTTIVFLFDEMSGVNSPESIKYNGNFFLDYSEYFFKKYNFVVYPNAETKYSSTIASIPSYMNFIKKADKQDDSSIEIAYKNYYQNYTLLNNKFFEKFKSISTFQNIHIDYCKHINVKKCDSYNAYKQESFVNGFKDSALTKIFAVLKLNGSIIGNLVFELFKRLRLIDDLVSPAGEKATLPNLLKKIEKDVISKKYDLIFIHTLVPHVPYGYTKDCSYDGKLSFSSSRLSTQQKIEQHNIERVCVLKFLDKSFNKLINKNLNIILISDTGSKIEGTNKLSTFLAEKNSVDKYKVVNQKILVSEFFINKFE